MSTGEGMSIESPLYGVDVSSYQGNVNWAAAASGGVTWMVAKATEGTYYTNPYYAGAIKGASAAGLVVGTYHFLTNGPAEKQLDNFLAATGKNLEGKLIMVDIEALEYNGVDYSPSFADVEAFVEGLASRIGKRPILLYSGTWYWGGYLGNPDLTDLAQSYGVRTWDARYVDGSGNPRNIYKKVPSSWLSEVRWGNQKPAILQFTDKASVAGQNMDADAFPGTRDELLRLTTKSNSAPKEKPDVS